jgi:tetratricopeptide (TPR) repeat protein
MIRRVTVIILILMLGATGAFGDEDSARYFTERGTKALDEKNYEGAKKHFEKALSEKEDFLPALLGLARTAEAEEKTQEAIAFLEKCLTAASKQKLDEEGEEVRKRAEDMLKKLDRARLEYHMAVSEYVAKLMSLAKKYKKKDPEIAHRCIERVLKLDPENEDAKAMREALGGKAAAPRPKKEPKDGEKEIWNGENFENWVGVGDAWSVEDGMMVGKAGSLAYRLRNDKAFKGNYTLEFEARVREDSDRVPSLTLRFAVQGAYLCHGFQIYKQGFELITYDKAEKKVALETVDQYVFSDRFDRRKWNKYRIRVKSGTVTIYVNGKKLMAHAGDGSSDYFDGYAGVVVQHCVGEFRRIALIE